MLAYSDLPVSALIATTRLELQNLPASLVILSTASPSTAWPQLQLRRENSANAEFISCRSTAPRPSSAVKTQPYRLSHGTPRPPSPDAATFTTRHVACLTTGTCCW